MKNALSKALASIVAVTLILTAFAGCGTTTKTDEKSAATVEKAAETKAGTAQAPGSDKKITITIDMHVANVKDQEPACYQMVQGFMQKYPNITVELSGEPTNDHVNKMKMAAQSDTLPDIFWLLPAPAAEMAKAGNLGDLSELMMKDNGEFTNRFNANMIDSYKLDGKQYGLPYQPLVTGFWYNKALFDKYNVKVPETYEDLKEAVKVFKKNNIVTISQGAKDPFSVWGWLIAICRYGYFDKIDKILAGQEKYKNPDFIKFYEKLEELTKLGAFPQNVSTMNYFQSGEMFLQGKCAMFDAGVWETKKIEDSAIAKDIGFWPGPTFSDGVGGQKIQMIVPAAPMVISSKVNKDKDKLEAVFKFMDFYYSNDGAKIMIENLVPPVIKYSGDMNAEKHPVFTKVVEQMNKPGWVSPKNQPDLVLTEAGMNAMYDSIYGVINGIYTPQQAVEVVDKKLSK